MKIIIVGILLVIGAITGIYFYKNNKTKTDAALNAAQTTAKTVVSNTAEVVKNAIDSAKK